MGESIKIHTVSTIPEDFNKFLDDFSDKFVKTQFAAAISGQHLKPTRVKEKEKESEEKYKKETKLGHGMKTKQEESYLKKQVKFKFEIMNIDFIVKFEFEEVDSNMDIYYKYKVKGGGMMSKMIAKAMSKAAGMLMMQGGIDAANKALQ